jgi:hypothetical protein
MVWDRYELRLDGGDTLQGIRQDGGELLVEEQSFKRYLKVIMDQTRHATLTAHYARVTQTFRKEFYAGSSYVELLDVLGLASVKEWATVPFLLAALVAFGGRAVGTDGAVLLPDFVVRAL